MRKYYYFDGKIAGKDYEFRCFVTDGNPDRDNYVCVYTAQLGPLGNKGALVRAEYLTPCQ